MVVLRFLCFVLQDLRTVPLGVHLSDWTQTEVMWCVSEVDASLTIADVRPGAPYHGVVTMSCSPPQWMGEEQTCEGSLDTSAALARVVFHACPQRISITKMNALCGKKQIKIKGFKQDQTTGVVTVDFDAESMGEFCSVLDLSVVFSSCIAPENIRTGVYCCAVKCSAVVTKGKGGGTRSDAGQPYNALFTHFEVYHAREAFPCPDDPKLRCGRWRVQLLLPSRMCQAVSNTPLLGDSKDGLGPGGSMRQYVFTKTAGEVLLPAYVVCFAAFCEGVMSIRSTTMTTKSHQHEIQLNLWAPVGSLFPMAFLEKVTRDAIEYLESFFDQPIPCEGGKMDVVVVPSMDLGGMEHHSCVFINESLCGQTSCSGSGGASGKGGAQMKVKMEEEIATMVVHELTHHWMGNAVGLPFELKEGVCLILEAAIGDLVLGRPMRKIAVEAQPSCHVVTSEKEAASTDEALKGRELTGHTYQAALRKMKAAVAELGWSAFESAMRRLVSQQFGSYVDLEVFRTFMACLPSV